MSYIAANNARSKLAAGLGALTSNAVVTISGGDSSKFPEINNSGLSPSDYSYLTIQDSAGNVEHMKISRHDTASASITVIRGAASGIVGVSDDDLRSWLIGDSVAITMNAQLVNDAFLASISAEQSAANALLASAEAVVTADEAKVLASGSFLSGTRMPFAQSCAPTGWTQDTSDNADNRMLRVVNTVNATPWPGVVTAGGNSAHSPIVMNVVPAHTHTFTTGAENAAHTHGVNDPGHTHTMGGSMQLYGSSTFSSAVLAQISNMNTSSSGTGISLGSETAAHAHAGSTDALSGAANWFPRYINMIICTRD